jgi:hypothetical protein
MVVDASAMVVARKMKTTLVTCDRCDAEIGKGLATTIAFALFAVQQHDRLDLCEQCARDLRAWVFANKPSRVLVTIPGRGPR